MIRFNSKVQDFDMERLYYHILPFISRKFKPYRGLFKDPDSIPMYRYPTNYRK